MFSESGAAGQTLAHVLCNDVDGFLGNHSVELHQLLMPQFLHDLSFLQERLGGHGARLQRLYRHSCGAVPRTCSKEFRKKISKYLNNEYVAKSELVKTK